MFAARVTAAPFLIPQLLRKKYEQRDFVLKQLQVEGMIFWKKHAKVKYGTHSCKVIVDIVTVEVKQAQVLSMVHILRLTRRHILAN